jgi:hypothetical protein
MCWESRVTSIYCCNCFVYWSEYTVSLMQHKIGDSPYKFRTSITTGISHQRSTLHVAITGRLNGGNPGTSQTTKALTEIGKYSIEKYFQFFLVFIW